MSEKIPNSAELGEEALETKPDIEDVDWAEMSNESSVEKREKGPQLTEVQREAIHDLTKQSYLLNNLTLLKKYKDDAGVKELVKGAAKQLLIENQFGTPPRAFEDLEHDYGFNAETAFSSEEMKNIQKEKIQHILKETWFRPGEAKTLAEQNNLQEELKSPAAMKAFVDTAFNSLGHSQSISDSLVESAEKLGFSPEQFLQEVEKQKVFGNMIIGEYDDNGLGYHEPQLKEFGELAKVFQEKLATFTGLTPEEIKKKARHRLMVNQIGQKKMENAEKIAADNGETIDFSSQEVKDALVEGLADNEEIVNDTERVLAVAEKYGVKEEVKTKGKKLIGRDLSDIRGFVRSLKAGDSEAIATDKKIASIREKLGITDEEMSVFAGESYIKSLAEGDDLETALEILDWANVDAQQKAEIRTKAIERFAVSDPFLALKLSNEFNKQEMIPGIAKEVEKSFWKNYFAEDTEKIGQYAELLQQYIPKDFAEVAHQKKKLGEVLHCFEPESLSADMAEGVFGNENATVDVNEMNTKSWDLLPSPLYRFEGSLSKNVADKLLDTGKALDVFMAREKFATDAVSDAALVYRITESVPAIIPDFFEKMHGVDPVATADRLMEKGILTDLANNLEKFPGADSAKLARLLFEKNDLLEIGALEKNRDKFTGLPQSFWDEVEKRNKEIEEGIEKGTRKKGFGPVGIA